MFEITIETSFSAAHALRLPGDELEPLHGHNWHVTLSVVSDQLDEIETVMDFHELQRIVQRTLAPLHNRHLNDIEPFATQHNPTAERVAWWIGTQVQNELPARVRLRYARVTEATHCAATWWGAMYNA